MTRPQKHVCTESAVLNELMEICFPSIAPRAWWKFYRAPNCCATSRHSSWVVGHDITHHCTLEWWPHKLLISRVIWYCVAPWSHTWGSCICLQKPYTEVWWQALNLVLRPFGTTCLFLSAFHKVSAPCLGISQVEPWESSEWLPIFGFNLILLSEPEVLGF